MKGTRWWPSGPQRVDWTLDLADLEFGPLRMETSADDIKRHLGRPANGTLFSVPTYLSYPSMNLRIDLDDGKMFGLEISWDDPEDDAGFDPRVRLGEGLYATARTLTVKMIEDAFKQTGEVDELEVTWERGGDIVYADLFEDGRICGIGFS